MTDQVRAEGRALRRLRLLRGVKQGDLAARLGVNQTTVSRWERGLLSVTPQQEAAILAVLGRPDPAGDRVLRGLVESSFRKLHLICDRTHRLLAVSPAREAEWRISFRDLAGRPMIGFASPEILAMEATLARHGWGEGGADSLELQTGANQDCNVPIRPGRVLWERLLLSDGTPARLVTTLT